MRADLITIPNSALRQVTNLSKDWSRVVLDVPIPVGEDMERVIELVGTVATTMAAEVRWREQILGEPVVAGVETIEVGYVSAPPPGFVPCRPSICCRQGAKAARRVALREAEIPSPVSTAALADVT